VFFCTNLRKTCQQSLISKRFITLPHSCSCKNATRVTLWKSLPAVPEGAGELGTLGSRDVT